MWLWLCCGRPVRTITLGRSAEDRAEAAMQGMLEEIYWWLADLCEAGQINPQQWWVENGRTQYLELAKMT